ncbi:MAG TPA: glycosyltransferase [Pilimelia sp.]|nr:glycosyltransferase [Pilimelia sp.]
MRIAMISEHASPLATMAGDDAGGQNTHVAELSIALAGLGHDVRVYTRRDAPDLPSMVKMVGGVDVAHVPAGPAEALPKDSLLPYMRDFGGYLAGQWRQDGWMPDVAHAHFWMSGLAAITASRPIGLPLVQTYHALGTVKRRHQGAADTSPPSRIGYERALGRAVDQVVAQCQDELGELLRMGVPRGRISLVPSGVDSERFTPDGPAEPRIGQRPRVLSVGRLIERKGFGELIRAMRVVPHAECVVVGGPPPAQLATDPQANRLRALATSCKVADRVRLVGAVPRDEMPRWYRSADVLVCPPWYEPFGLTPLEAMACGVPVVATAVGGLTDTVVDGLTGDLVRPRDPRALGATVRKLLNDPMRRLAYATAALDRARQAYSWKRCAAQLSSIYGALTATRRPSGAVA